MIYIEFQRVTRHDRENTNLIIVNFDGDITTTGGQNAACQPYVTLHPYPTSLQGEEHYGYINTKLRLTGKTCVKSNYDKKKGKKDF